MTDISQHNSRRDAERALHLTLKETLKKWLSN
jgi:hypothetical protein